MLFDPPICLEKLLSWNLRQCRFCLMLLCALEHRAHYLRVLLYNLFAIVAHFNYNSKITIYYKLNLNRLK